MLPLWKGMKRIYFVFWSGCRLFLFEAMSDSFIWKGETYTRFYCMTLLLAIFSYLYFKKLVLFMLVDEINPQAMPYVCGDRCPGWLQCCVSCSAKKVFTYCRIISAAYLAECWGLTCNQINYRTLLDLGVFLRPWFEVGISRWPSFIYLLLPKTVLCFHGALCSLRK